MQRALTMCTADPCEGKATCMQHVLAHARTNGDWEALGGASGGAAAGGVACFGEHAKGPRQAAPQAAAGVVCIGAAPGVRHALRVDMRAEHHLHSAHSTRVCRLFVEQLILLHQIGMVA
jgi:hypothetical protein